MANDRATAQALRRSVKATRPELQGRSDTVSADSAMEAVRTILRFIGEDPAREGLRDTPYRVCKAMLEATAGNQLDPAATLSRVFGEQSDDMVIVERIEFRSTCEHHLLPFIGVAAVGYIPSGGRVVGLSKIPALVKIFADRLQLQEKLTREIADAMVSHLRPKGVAVVMRARHLCMCGRGVNQPHAVTTTSAVRGVLKNSASARSELVSLISGHPLS